MRIVYVAKHESGGNDEEGAITQALVAQGHDVQRVREHKGAYAPRIKGDMLLFHKWSDPAALAQMAQRMPCFFWYFDLVDWPSDPSLRVRCELRKDWMKLVLPVVKAGFCTDGDWAARYPAKLHWLPQGAVNHKATAVIEPEARRILPILFTGIARGGEGRLNFVRDMERYGSKFHHVTHGRHGAELANLVSKAKIVVAPDSPVTDSYWSNRIYVMLGYGAFLLHPYCAKLAEQYTDGEHLVFYRDKADLHRKIAYYLDSFKDRERIAAAGLAHTLQQHTMSNRCEALIKKVRELCPHLS